MESFEKQNCIEDKKKRKKEREKIRNEFGKRLEEAIKDAGYKKVEFAKEVGVDKSTVSAWCIGTQQPDNLNLQKILDVLNKRQRENGEKEYDKSYFRVDTECKNSENEKAYKELKLKDEPLETIKKVTNKDTKINTLFDDGSPLNYTNMTNYLLSQEELYETFYKEIESTLLEILKKYPHGSDGEKYNNVIKDLDINVPEKISATVKNILNNYIKELLKSYFPQK